MIRAGTALLVATWIAAATTAYAQTPPASPAAGPGAPSPSAGAPARGGWRVIDSFDVGPTVYVRALALEARRGAMWVGTSAGVHEVDLATLKPRNTFVRKDGLANEYVFGIGIDRDGYKWFGTNAGGATRYKDGKFKTYFPMHGLADYWIYTFASQKDGTLWIGTWAGASRFDLKTGKFRNYVKELVNEWVYGLGVDTKDRVWFGTEGGVSMYDGKRWQSWTHRDGLGAPNRQNLPASANTGLGTRSRHDLSTAVEGEPSYNRNYVFSILVEQNDTVWAGTWGGGAAHFDGKRWTNLTTQDGLAGDIVYAIVQEPGGAIWFGTNRGVTRYDGKSMVSLGKRDGLLEDHVYALALTPGGELWAGTKRGVTRIGRP
ncbi:MAG: regulator [Burkholderiales bacterium]|nr:regulator [Burkholderiales bacterium]